MHKKFRSHSRRGGLNYNALEERRLLAMLVMGDHGNDQVQVSFVDVNTVTVQINETVMENLDVSDGIRINTKGGQDRVWIDRRITAEIGVFHSEELEISGGDNFWQVGFKIDPPPEGMLYFDAIGLPGKTAGRVNGNISFLGTQILRGGAGHDRFSINTQSLPALNIYGGDGNDLFRFSAESRFLLYPNATGPTTVVAHGEGGHDRFVYHKNAQALAIGGADFDIVDYRNSRFAANETFGDIRDGVWGGGNERIIGAEGQPNQFRIRTNGQQDYHFNWIVEGKRTAVSDNEHQGFVELINFNQFHADTFGYDNFWIQATSDNIWIHDADWIQISSEFQAADGNLNSIDHDITILKSSMNVANEDTIVRGQPATPSASLPPVQVDMDGVLNPRVIISDATGDGAIAKFIEDQSIIGLTSGTIRFGASRFLARPLPHTDQSFLPFDPEIIIHGSLAAADYFTFEHTWSETTVYSHGGDDTFMFGSTNRDANGDMNQIRGSVNVYAGDGTDRVYVNDQKSMIGTSRYQISDQSIRDISRIPIAGQPSFNDSIIANRFADIRLNQSVELSRINGSAVAPNYFEVVPSGATRFIVQGSNEAHDRLSVVGLEPFRRLYHHDNVGAWTFGNLARNVNFIDIDNPIALHDLVVGMQGVKLDSSTFQSLANESTESDLGDANSLTDEVFAGAVS